MNEVAARRLRNQRLEGEPLAGPREVVHSLGGVQAQEYPVARWSIGQRAGGLSEAAVDRALADAAILRTHVLRETWHLVAAEDIRWMVELTRPRISARNVTMYRKLELEPPWPASRMSRPTSTWCCWTGRSSGTGGAGRAPSDGHGRAARPPA